MTDTLTALVADIPSTIVRWTGTLTVKLIGGKAPAYAAFLSAPALAIVNDDGTLTAKSRVNLSAAQLAQLDDAMRVDADGNALSTDAEFDARELSLMTAGEFTFDATRKNRVAPLSMAARAKARRDADAAAAAATVAVDSAPDSAE
jgi:hypothetical protein